MQVVVEALEGTVALAAVARLVMAQTIRLLVAEAGLMVEHCLLVPRNRVAA
jgi:hypothetical protein